MAADQPGALWMPVPIGLIFPGYEGNRPKWLVVHKTGGPGDAEQQAKFFAGPNNVNKASTHYVVGQDGVVVQCVSEADGAGGNCCLEPGHASFLPTNINLNLLTISIEHCDPALDNSTPVTPEQQAASFKLIRDICTRHAIPMRPGDANGGIIGHKDIAPVDRSHCPGNYPWEALWAYLQGGTSDMMNITDPFVAAHFVQTATGPDRWHCKESGFDLFAGILMGWRQMNGAPRLPKGPEIKCGKTAVCQECEGGIVVYDPDKELDAPGGPWAPCYLLHLDSPLAKQLLASNQATQNTINVSDAVTQLHSIQTATGTALKDLGAS
jgi:hypothetical protein